MNSKVQLFEEGDKVRFNKPRMYHHPEGVLTVKEIVPVPEKEIGYNPITHEGGVGHPQWVITEEYPNMVSGALLELAARKGEEL
jgi:hypothetical protein